MPIPPKIANAPELTLGLELYYEGFIELNSCRQMGFGAVGEIPVTAVLQYARTFDFTEEQTSDLMYFIKKMDHEFIKSVNPKKKD